MARMLSKIAKLSQILNHIVFVQNLVWTMIPVPKHHIVTSNQCHIEMPTPINHAKHNMYTNQIHEKLCNINGKSPEGGSNEYAEDIICTGIREHLQSIVVIKKQ